MKSSTVFWLVVFVLGAIGLVVGNRTHPPGFGVRYATMEEHRFVKVEVAPPIGADNGEAVATRWVPEGSSELAQPNVRIVDGVAPIVWSQREVVPPRQAWNAVSGNSVTAAGPQPFLSWIDTIGVWVAALATLAIFSFLWGDNPIYKVAESVLVGVSAAYWMVVHFWSTLVPNLVKPLAPEMVRAWALPGIEANAPTQWIALIPLALGIMLLMRLSPKGGWIAVWPLAFIFGTTAGLKLISFVQADLLGMIANSIVPLVALRDGEGVDVSATLGHITLIAGILCVLTYFFFSIEHKGMVGRVSRVGVWVLMITFGAAFGFTVMGRITLLSERLEFLFDDWLWLIDPQGVRVVAQATGTMLWSLIA